MVILNPICIHIRGKITLKNPMNNLKSQVLANLVGEVSSPLMSEEDYLLRKFNVGNLGDCLTLSPF